VNLDRSKTITTAATLTVIHYIFYNIQTVQQWKCLTPNMLFKMHVPTPGLFIAVGYRNKKSHKKLLSKDMF